MSKLKGWLVVSLVLNVFLLGAAGGGLYSWLTRHHAAAPRGLRFAAKELPSSRQDEFSAALRDMRHDEATHVLVREARRGRHEVVALLSAPQFDATALNAALARTRDADIALRARAEGVVVGFAATLTPDERLKLVDALEQHGPLRFAPGRKATRVPALKPGTDAATDTASGASQ